MSRPLATIEAKALANLFLDWAADEGIGVTPLKLQKLLFFCHAECLVQFGTPLVKENFEAWSYGPVVPSVYSEFKSFSEREITTRAFKFDPLSRQRIPVSKPADDTLPSTLRSLFSIYIKVSAGHLSGMSHASGGPWDRTRRAFEARRNINREISNELIAKHHRTRAQHVDS